MWRQEDPQGNESAKVRFDLVPYMHGRILDLGCGVQKVFPIAIGIDNRIDAKLFGIEVKPDIAVDSCERMPWLADDAADATFSSHLLEHIADYQAALKEWWRVTKTDGHLILYLPNNEDAVESGGYPKMGEHGANPDHKWDVSYERVVEAMKSVGSWDLVEFEKRNQGQEYSLLFVFRKTAEGQRFSYRDPKPVQKTLGIVRLGAYGDALWISGLLPKYKAEGYHITVYTQPQGEEVLRYDPNIDRIICQPIGLFDFADGRVAMWQTAYWLHEEKKYDRFINMIGSTERRLLPQPFDPDFYLPFEQRHRMMNRNYIEALHEWVGVTFVKASSKQKFYPNAEELSWAAQERAKIDGPLIIINPAGSSAPKWWPYTQELADMLATERIHSIIVGDLRFHKLRPSRFSRVVGTEWPIRRVFALAAMADAVVGTESAVVNAVAYEEPLKVVLLSHSTHENLTRDWHNTISLEPEGLKCYPCHRIHADMSNCSYDRETQSASCQAAAKAELVFERIRAYLAARENVAPVSAYNTVASAMMRRAARAT
ncbi:MAG: methyltransferase domain-containing protein [Gemmatimonadaceae bacterium]